MTKSSSLPTIIGRAKAGAARHSPAGPRPKRADPPKKDELAPLVAKELTLALVTGAARVIDLFHQWDSSGDGLIQKSEFRSGLEAFGLRAEPGEIDLLFDAWDSDNSGSLSLMELHRILRHGGSISLPRSLRHDAITQREVLGLELNDLRASMCEGERAKEDWRHIRAKASLIGKMQLAQALDRTPVRDVSAVEHERLLAALAEHTDGIVDTLSDWDGEFKGDGTVTKRDFWRAMAVVGVKTERDIADSLFTSFDEELAGTLEISILDSRLREAAGRKAKPSARSGGTSNLLGHHLFQDGDKTVQEQLRHALVHNSVIT